MPEVSVVVPVYKAENYIHKCIESILSQTFTDFELILVDDGSPDSCGIICEEYAVKDSRISVIHQKNGGPSAARNTGLSVATGKYICFVDSDDYIAENTLSVAVPQMEKGYDLVVFRFTMIDENGNCKKISYKSGEYIVGSSKERVSFIVNELLQHHFGWEPHCRLFRRDIIEQHKLRFDNNIMIAEDMGFSLLYFAYAKKLFVLDEYLYYYIQHSGSIMASQCSRLNAGTMTELAKGVLGFYRQNGVEKALIDAFPIIYYYMMETEISKFFPYGTVPLEKMRLALQANIKDYTFFAKQMKQVRKFKSLLPAEFGAYHINERVAIAEYMADGNIFFFKIKCKLNTFFNKI